MKIGIDLGTSYSLVGRMHPDGATSLIPDTRDEERYHTPSTVVISGDDAFVGALAEDLVEDHPELPAIRFFKRQLGDREEIYFDERGRGWHAEGLSALVLSKLRFDAETEGSRRVEGAVISVPAHFNDRQRKAVAAAASLAELPLLDLVDEPVAAALHYGVATQAHGEVLLTYDFGGGTFDATTLSLDERGIYVLSKTGLTELGGKEVDEIVGEMLLEQFEHALGAAPDLNARTLLELRRASEALKIALCEPGDRRVRKTVLLGSEAVEVVLDRRRFEAAVEPLVEETMANTLRCLQESGLKPDDVTTVLLVGGSSWIPSVERRLKEVFGGGGGGGGGAENRIRRHEPSKAVAYGAAMRAAQVAGEADAYRLPAELKGVTGYSVGVRTLDPSSGGVAIDNLVKKNMPLPARASKTYYTTRADQSHISLELVQHRGDGAPPVPLGTLTVGPLERPRLNYPVEVGVEYREDGTVRVRATDADSGRELEQSFGGDPAGDIEYLASQRKQLMAVSRA